MASQQHNRPNPADHTGRKAEEAKEHEEQMKADQAAEAEAEREAAESDEHETGAVDDEIVVDEPEEVPVQAEYDDGASALASESKREMRVTADLENMVYGRDMFTFKKGTRYLVPKSVYEHLDRLGYVYH